MHIKIKNVNELVDGKSTNIEYILKSIQDGNPILTKNSWPKESL